MQLEVVTAAVAVRSVGGARKQFLAFRSLAVSTSSLSSASAPLAQSRSIGMRHYTYKSTYN